VKVRLTTVPRPGYLTVSAAMSTILRPPNLSEGVTSPAVSDLARQLAALHYAVPSLSSTFSYDLVESVWAFQKVQGLDRTGAVDPQFWTKLADPRLPHPRYSEPADHIEVDKAHQVLYIVRNDQITMISPVATAGIAGYYTPEGKFAIYRKVTGWDTSPLGVLWNPMYFTGGYAIHGGDPVPPYPASHGCVRVPDFVISRLFYSEPYGEVVYVYS
jgi:lipoprotein-anchoring transpeptidase ErfK/SrfK